MKRKLGNTGLIVSEVGFGGIPIQRTDSVTVKEILEALIENGVNFIDTARGYTISEELIGKALKEKNRQDFIIATKSMARTYEAMKSDIKQSLVNLQTEYIDLYQVHNLKTLEDYKILLSDNGAYRALIEAKDNGLIRHIGITSHNLDFLESIIDDDLFETIQYPYNIIEQQAEKLFARAYQRGLGIICMKPLGGGMFKNAELAIKFILNNPHISVAIVGMDSAIQVKANCSITSGVLSIEQLNEIEEVRNNLGNDFCRRCGYCMPCTKEIDIPNCFMFESYYKRYNLKKWAEERYHGMIKKASDCIRCGKCEVRCPYKLKITEKLQQVFKTFGV